MIVNFITKYIFLLLLIFSSCAVQAPPSGGEEDTVSPYIVEVSPLSGSMNLSDKDRGLVAGLPENRATAQGDGEKGYLPKNAQSA